MYLAEASAGNPNIYLIDVKLAVKSIHPAFGIKRNPAPVVVSSSGVLV